MWTAEQRGSLPVTRRWREQIGPIASVLALIRRDERPGSEKYTANYLLISRRKEPYTGKWALVGGRWEFGESLEQAVTREVREETGLDASFVALRGLVNERIVPLGPDGEGAHFLLFICEVSAPAGEALEQSEGPVAWFGVEELETLKARQQIVSSDYAILQCLHQSDMSIPYFEAEVAASKGENASDKLIRFESGP